MRKDYIRLVCEKAVEYFAALKPHASPPMPFSDKPGVFGWGDFNQAFAALSPSVGPAVDDYLNPAGLRLILFSRSDIVLLDDSGEHYQLLPEVERAIPEYDRIDGLDAGIADIVNLLRKHGVETFESCQGGQGHAFPEPTVRFHGGDGAGFHALGVALTHDLRVSALRRSWSVQGRTPTGPYWELTFWLPEPKL